LVQYGDSALLKQSLSRWIDNLKTCSRIVSDAEQPGQPSVPTADESTEHVCVVI